MQLYASALWRVSNHIELWAGHWVRTQSGFEIVFRLIGDQTQRTQVTVTGNAGPRLLSVSFVSKILHLYFSLPRSRLHLRSLKFLWDLREPSVTNAPVREPHGKTHFAMCALTQSRRALCRWVPAPIKTHTEQQYWSVNRCVLQQRYHRAGRGGGEQRD